MQRRWSWTRLFVALFATAACLTLVISSGGVPISDVSETDEIADDVHVAPHPGANSGYAYLDASGELVVDLSVSNPNLDGQGPNRATTTIDDVFVISHTGSESDTKPVRVWIDHDVEGVTFHTHGEPIESRSDGVVLAPDEAASVGVRVNGSAVDGRIHETFTIGTERAERTAASARRSCSSSVDVRMHRDDARATISASVCPDEPVDVELDGITLGDRSVTLDRIEFVSTQRGSVDVDAQIRREPPGGDDAPDDVLAYVRIDDDPSDVSLDHLAFDVTIERDGVEPTDVLVYERTDRGWERLDATTVDRIDDGVRVRVDAINVSTVALAVDGAPIEATTPAGPAESATDHDTKVDREGGQEINREQGEETPSSLLIVFTSLALALLGVGTVLLGRRWRFAR